MNKKDGSFQIYSPEKKEVWRYESKRLNFSIFEQGMFAVDAVGVDWSTHKTLLIYCFTSTAKLGFFRVTPWFPGRKILHESLLARFPTCVVIGGDIFGYFDINTQNLEIIFNLWHERGGWGSGEWQIGSCQREFSEIAIMETYPGLEFFLREIHHIGCILSLEEMQQSTLLTHPFPGLSSIIKSLLGTEIE